ncbi:glutamate ABC transporter substrate-binding protein [Streptomyces albiaxialis]|uniref:Glutamate ABC transporter substrate-binding protein n=1 Tax=Streptomyces albiaxialis TaxID=329523 RepID=A0ABN2VP57_9ACTN
MAVPKQRSWQHSSRHPWRRPSRRSSLGALLCCAALVPALTGCGLFGEEEKEDAEPVKVASDTDFPQGSTMEKLHDAGTIRIGVKYDQPGIGYRESGADAPEGFDIEMARIIAGQLGIRPEKIKWVETQSQNREKYLRDKTVDLVLASYSITSERRELVGMAGPYYETGQQLLVRKGDKNVKTPKDIAGKQVCSAKGATSIPRIRKEYRAQPVARDTYAQCVRQLLGGSVDAVTTDGAMLLGYAAQRPDELKVIGEQISSERYAVGYRKGDSEMCDFINQSLTRSFRDGTWTAALNKTLWKTSGAVGYPTLDPCT